MLGDKGENSNSVHERKLQRNSQKAGRCLLRSPASVQIPLPLQLLQPGTLRNGQLGLGRQLEGHRLEAAIPVAGMHRRDPRTDAVVDLEGHVGDTERLEDPRLEHFAEPLAGDALDDLADPVDIGAVLPLRARIEQQRRHQRGLRRGDDTGLAPGIGQRLVRLVEEVEAEAKRRGKL